MQSLMEHVAVFFLCVLVLLLVASFAGAWWRGRRAGMVLDESFKTLEGAMLGLLALLLGFSFAMAVGRYDVRHQLQVDEANDLGTLWLRTDLLSDPAKTREQELIRSYVPARMAFFDAGTETRPLIRSLQHGSELQQQMWDTAMADAATRRDPATALFVSALNDTIDVSEKRTAALENRIPTAAWILLLFIGAVCCALVGVNTGRRSAAVALPMVIAGVMMLIADLDSPRSGFIQVRQSSMERLAAQVSAR